MAAVLSAHNKAVIEAFKNHKEYKRRGRNTNNLWTNGETIFSYGMPLVIRRDGELEWQYEKGHKVSVTTSRHMRVVEWMLGRE